MKMKLERPFRESATQNRVVTMAFLSKYLPTSLLGEETARWLRHETGASVVFVRIKPSAANGIKKNGDLTDLIQNRALQFSKQVTESEFGLHTLNIGLGGEMPTAESVATLVEDLRRRFSYVLFDVNIDELPACWLLEFLSRSDICYLFLRPASEDVYQLNLLANEVQARSEDAGARITPVLCLAEDEAVAG